MFMQRMSQTSFKQTEISQILLKPNSKHFDNQKRVSKGVAFCIPPEFYTPKSPGLIGLKLLSEVIPESFQNTLTEASTF